MNFQLVSFVRLALTDLWASNPVWRLKSRQVGSIPIHSRYPCKRRSKRLWPLLQRGRSLLRRSPGSGHSRTPAAIPGHFVPRLATDLQGLRRPDARRRDSHGGGAGKATSGPLAALTLYRLFGTFAEAHVFGPRLHSLHSFSPTLFHRCPAQAPSSRKPRSQRGCSSPKASCPSSATASLTVETQCTVLQECSRPSPLVFLTSESFDGPSPSHGNPVASETHSLPLEYWSRQRCPPLGAVHAAIPR